MGELINEIKYGILDWNGTLKNDREHIFEAVNRLREIYNLKNATFEEISEALDKENLLIKNGVVNGIVPYNVGLLRWRTFDIVAMAESWGETLKIVSKIDKIFNNT